MEWCLATIFVAGKGILASWKVDFKLVKMIPESQKSVESFFNVCKSSNVHLPEFGCKWSITGFDFPIQKIAACITSKGLFISTASCNEDTSVVRIKKIINSDHFIRIWRTDLSII